MLVDEAGTVLDGDDVLIAWARKLAADNRLPGGRVVATVMSNFGLEHAIKDEGLELIRCSVGDRWVWEAMGEHGAVLGGEQSGHVICSHYGVSGDGLLTGSHLLAIAAHRQIPMSKLSGIHRFPQILINVPVSKKKPFEELPDIRRGVEETERQLADRGRLLLRYSGTEALARVMIEGEDAGEIETLANELADKIRNELG